MRKYLPLACAAMNPSSAAAVNTIRPSATTAPRRPIPARRLRRVRPPCSTLIAVEDEAKPR